MLIGLLSLIIGYIIKLIPEGFYQSFEIFSVQKVFDRAEEEAKERERELERLKEERKQLKKIKNFNKG